MSEAEITGTLENWFHAPHGIIYGTIFGDTRNRFEDGTEIRTSFVERVENGIAYTMNSTYKLGKKYEV